MKKVIANDGTEKMTFFYGTSSGLIYGLCTIDQFPEKMKDLNDFYDSLKLLIAYNEKVNEAFNERLEKTNNFDLALNEPLCDIELPNERVFQAELPSKNTNNCLGRRYYQSNLSMLQEYTQEVKVFGKAKQDKSVKSMLEISSSKASTSTLGNLKVPLESIGISEIRIDNLPFDSYQDRVNFEYSVFKEQNKILKELGIFIPNDFKGFVDYHVNKERVDTLADYR